MAEPFPDVVIQRLTVWGAVHLMVSWTGSNETDGWVPDEIAEFCCGPHLDTIMKIAIRQKLVIGRRRHPEFGMGWLVQTQHEDQLLNVETKEQKAKRLEAQRNRRVPKTVKDQVYLRDGDTCRWDGAPVHPNDTRGGRMRHLDHIDPDGPSTVENVVVSCATCNDKRRHGEQLQLQPEPKDGQVYWTDATLAYLTKAGLSPRPTDGTTALARPVDDHRDSGAAASGDHAQLPGLTVEGPNPTEGAGPYAGVGRVGSGRVGNRSARGGKRHRPPA